MPTIGYTTEGATTDSGTTGAVCNTHSSTLLVASTGDVVTGISFYLGTLTAQSVLEVGIYEFAAGLPNTLISPASDVAVTSSAGLYSISGLNIPLTSGVTYGVAIGVPAPGRASYKYDILSGNRRSYYNASHLPATWIHASYSASQRSVFFEYTAGGGGGGSTLPVFINQMKLQGIL